APELGCAHGCARDGHRSIVCGDRAVLLAPEPIGGARRLHRQLPPASHGPPVGCAFSPRDGDSADDRRRSYHPVRSAADEPSAERPRVTYLDGHAGEIVAAAGRIAPYVRRTPLLRTDLDTRLRLKPECFQVAGSFKARGAFNAVLRLKQRQGAPKGVISVSSGNHAQALALAARTAGLPAVTLIPFDASPAKVAATQALGAEIIQAGITFENREQRVREVMA